MCGLSEREKQGASSQVRPRAELQEWSKAVGDVGAGTGWTGEGRRSLTGSDSAESKTRGLLGQNSVIGFYCRLKCLPII